MSDKLNRPMRAVKRWGMTAFDGSMEEQLQGPFVAYAHFADAEESEWQLMCRIAELEAENAELREAAKKVVAYFRGSINRRVFYDALAALQDGE